MESFSLCLAATCLCWLDTLREEGKKTRPRNSKLSSSLGLLGRKNSSYDNPGVCRSSGSTRNKWANSGSVGVKWVTRRKCKSVQTTPGEWRAGERERKAEDMDETIHSRIRARKGERERERERKSRKVVLYVKRGKRKGKANKFRSYMMKRFEIKSMRFRKPETIDFFKRKWIVNKLEEFDRSHSEGILEGCVDN